MEILINILIFILLFFLYLHIHNQLKRSEDLEISEMDYYDNENLQEICETPGIDGVFIGPADLSASLGFPGQTEHPEVLVRIEKAIEAILRAGKAPGILTTNESLARRYLELGVLFICVGLDTNLLMQHTRALAARFKGAATPSTPSGMGY